MWEKYVYMYVDMWIYIYLYYIQILGISINDYLYHNIYTND